MGQRVECSAEFKGEVSKGIALLEPDSLTFRGDFKLVISLKQIKSVKAERGKLKISFPKGTVVFRLGPLAEKWEMKIRHPKGLMAKLGIKPESKVVVLGIKGERFLDQLKKQISDVSQRRRKNADLILMSAESKSDLRRIAQLKNYIKRDGAIWIIAPKGKQHIKESDVLEAGKKAGLVDIKVVSFSNTHTAHKFVIPVAQR